MSAHINPLKSKTAFRIAIMFGDPLRAKWVANKYLTKVKSFNEIRNMLAYTGEYKGQNVIVMGHGMGIPSIGIYAYELFNDFNVDYIIRVGTCGSFVSDINAHDVLIVKDAYSHSRYGKDIGFPFWKRVFKSDQELLEFEQYSAEELKIPYKIVRVYSNDAFYGDIQFSKIVRRTKAKVVEMEAYALFAEAQRFNKSAGCILTCADSVFNKEMLTAQERETKLDNAVLIALKAITKLPKMHDKIDSNV